MGQLRQRIRVLRTATLSIKATADYQSCSAAAGRCMPGSKALALGPLTIAGPAQSWPKTHAKAWAGR